MVSILVANGYECAEALVTLDLLHRAGIAADLIGLNSDEVVSANGVTVKANRVLGEVGAEAVAEDLELLVLAGGNDNVNTLRRAPEAKKLITQVAAAGKPLAAICAAPLILSDLGLVAGKKVTCYPGKEAGLHGAKVQVGSKVVVDGGLITGQGPGAVFDFALELVEFLRGKEKMQQVKDEIYYQD